MGFGRAEAKRCDGWQSKTQGGAGGWGGKGFLWGRVGGSHYVIVLCWNFIFKIVSLTVYCKRFYKIPLFTILLLFYLFCIYWEWQDQKCNLKCPKVSEITTELYFFSVICTCIHTCDTNTFTHGLSHKNTFTETENQ